jgi:hypothetical protein
MAVQNIECQIATVLMKRYLDGDNLPQNLLDDLERHLKACPSCQAILNNEHANIEEVLDGPAPVKGLAGWMGKLATQPATASGFVTAGAGEALMQASYRTQYAPPTGPGMAVLKSPKVLFLSLALAATLIAMSTILRNPSALLGPKATAGAAASYTEPAEKTDKKETEGSHGKEEHSSEESSPEEHHSEESTDPHVTAEEDHPDHGAEDTHAKADEPKSETHTDQNPTTPKFEEVNDPRVPGKPTIDDSELIIAGGKSPQKPPTKNETKTDSHSAPKTAPKPAAKPPAKSATKSTTKPRTASRPRTTTSKPKSTPAKKPSGGGITVYDENGKPIKN